MDSPAADNNPTTTLALRPHRTSGGGSGGGGGSGREDCWSEGATAVLIEAWGERHLRCNRGNLRQNDWLEVAEAVNSREDGSKPRKSDVQCKNRIDTLKKKYKVEKAKPVSSWPFFSRLDYLISPGGAKMAAGLQPETAAADGSGLLLPKNHPSRFRLNAGPNPNPNSVRSSNPRLSGQWSGGSSSRFNSAYSSESESSLGGGENHGRSAGSGLIGGGRRGGGGGAGRKHGRMEDYDNPPESTETAFRELARAILKFGEIYERIETSKQSQMMELEKQRMEFMKELELQRMNMIMEAQLEIEKLKRSKNSSTSGKKL